ncbi:MAG: HAD family hydrolase [bacterium]
MWHAIIESCVLPRNVRGIFFDAEGTLWYPKVSGAVEQFWRHPTVDRALELFQVEPDLAETLAALRRSGIPLIVVSKHVQPLLEQLLEAFKLRGYFDSVLVASDKAAAIQRFVTEHRLDPILMIGDTPEVDVTPVRRSGFAAVLVDRAGRAFSAQPTVPRLSLVPALLGLQAWPPKTGLVSSEV